MRIFICVSSLSQNLLTASSEDKALSHPRNISDMILDSWLSVSMSGCISAEHALLRELILKTLLPSFRSTQTADGVIGCDDSGVWASDSE